MSILTDRRVTHVLFLQTEDGVYVEVIVAGHQMKRSGLRTWALAYAWATGAAEHMLAGVFT